MVGRLGLGATTTPTPTTTIVLGFFCMAWHGMARGILQAYFAKAVLYPMVVRGMAWLGLACFELTYFP